MKIATIVGARPQFIKAATVSRVISQSVNIKELLIHTGQHFDPNMSDVFFKELDIRSPDVHLGIGGGTHGQNTGRMIEAIEQVLISEKPECVLVFGDTDSTLAGALASVKLHIPVAHIEAGLRSFNRKMPEEINRVITDHISTLLFAPTYTAIANLASEGIKGDQVQMVGDVMYDAALYYRANAKRPTALPINDNKPFILCTVHRAENTDNPIRLRSIIDMLNQLAEENNIILPLHPRTEAAIKRLHGQGLSRQINSISPVGFLEMAWLLENCILVLTDSGGLQKEAYFYEKPCVTLREETEWVELIKEGCNVLLSPGTLYEKEVIKNMINRTQNIKKGLFGEGLAANKIVSFIQNKFQKEIL